MGFDITRAIIILDNKPANVDEIRLIFTKTSKSVTKQNYIDSVVFPELVKKDGVWYSEIYFLNPSGVITHIDSDTAYARVNFYPGQPMMQSVSLSLMTPKSTFFRNIASPSCIRRNPISSRFRYWCSKYLKILSYH